jgi:hypothetical protein
MAFTKCDWSEGVWEGATAGCSVFVGLFGTVAEEIGKEKAFALLKKLGEGMGKGAGQMFKEQLGDEKIDIKKLAQFIIGFNGPFGCQMEIEEEPTHFRLRHHNCPVAQAFKNMATDYETGKRICYDWGVTLFENLLNVLAPEAKYEVAHYRENWDDYCEEKYTLET